LAAAPGPGRILPRFERSRGKIAAMLRLLYLLAVLAATGRAESPKTSLDLLAGRNLAAWELVTLPATPADVSNICKFGADGSLAIAGKPVSYLATKAAYENYRLHVEWRWPANAAKNSNGGVLLNLTGGPTGGTAWPVCFQAQMKLTRAGDLLPMNGARFAEQLSTPAAAKTPQLDRTTAADPEKPLGEWNSYDIVCRGDTIEVAVNGVQQNKITQCVPAAGKIGFQLEGTPFELRNVRIEPLK
jgi:hypothetical protein